MTNPNRRRAIVTPVPALAPAAHGRPDVLVAEASAPPPRICRKVNARYIWFMVLAQFGVFMAFITPIAISLAVRLGELAPEQPGVPRVHHRRRRPVRDADRPVHGHLERPHPHPARPPPPVHDRRHDRRRRLAGRDGAGAVGAAARRRLDPRAVGLGNRARQPAELHRRPTARKSQRGKVAGLTGFATQVAPVIGVIATIGSDRQRAAALPRPRSRRRGARHPVRDPGARGRQPRAAAASASAPPGCCASTSTTRASTPTSRGTGSAASSSTSASP